VERFIVHLENCLHNSATAKVTGKSHVWGTDMPEDASDYSSAINRVIAVCKESEEGFRGTAMW